MSEENNKTTVPEVSASPTTGCSECRGEGCKVGGCGDVRNCCAKCNRTPGEGCGHRDECNKVPRGTLHCYNYLEGISDSSDFDIVQVQFKNTRKGFYRNSLHLPLKEGDIVAVESSPGHDIGEVTMTGKLVAVQMRHGRQVNESELKRVFRLAKPSDLEKYAKAKAREHDTMIQSRKIAEELELNMKIGDVEYQGDGAKAIFYYIADERVDFRKLIRVLADTFHVKIEMKQIGARQEAGRIGGIGPCGRPLCCATWISNFNSVGTSAARFQDISMNPQKLAGQCAKLKCCLNYEVDTYMEAQKQMPHRDIVLETKDGEYYHFKSDILKRELTYSTDKKMPVNCVTIPARRAFEIIALNKQGIKVDALEEEGTKQEKPREFVELVGQDNINRFDKKKKNKRKRNDDRGQRNNGGGNNDRKPKTEDRKSKTEDKQTQQTEKPQADNNQQQGQQNRHQRNDRRQRNNHRQRNNKGDNPNRNNANNGEKND